MIKTRYWILLIVLIFTLSVLLFFIFNNKKQGNVEIVQDGTVIYTIDLDSTQNEYDLIIKYGENDFNKVHVCRGDIYISDSSCNGRDCVNRGHISAGGFPIVCAPNKLIIRYTDNRFDGIAG